jgi:hypothetical protein
MASTHTAAQVLWIARSIREHQEEVLLRGGEVQLTSCSVEGVAHGRLRWQRRRLSGCDVTPLDELLHVLYDLGIDALFLSS